MKIPLLNNVEYLVLQERFAIGLALLRKRVTDGGNKRNTKSQ